MHILSVFMVLWNLPLGNLRMVFGSSCDSRLVASWNLMRSVCMSSCGIGYVIFGWHFVIGVIFELGMWN